MLMSWIFGTKYASHFQTKWTPIIHSVITYGSILNWGEIISSHLDTQLKKVQKEHQFYMSLYLLDVMCASQEYLVDDITASEDILWSLSCVNH